MPAPPTCRRLRPLFVAGLVAGAAAAEAWGQAPAEGPPRPNILWISAEDLSAATLGCYGGSAHTPRIDGLARAGLVFDKAYAAAPVCAPSRSAIITGVMPTTLGATPQRCLATPPGFLVGFPQFLHDAGYFCTNNAKTDYNLPAGFDAGWDAAGGEAHWRQRPDPARPFFAVFNFTVTHESGLFAAAAERARRRAALPAEARRDPRAIVVPPHYPDTPAVRDDLAHRLELAALLDREVGRVLDALEQDGLAEDTIVFFWSDHGEGLPRGKRSLTEFGLRVPLVVRVPEKFRGRATRGPDAARAPGGRSDLLVSLLDLGPTVLDLAGVAAPAWMEGRSFLGPHAVPADERTFVVGVRDRMDAAEGLGRTVTDGRYRYVRNLLPWIGGDDLPAYAAGLPITGALRQAARAGTLPPGGEWFFRRRRPVEELYDLAADPDELVNLAADPAHAAELSRLRAACIDWMRRTRDTGVLPEAIMRREALAAGSEWAVFHPPGDDAAAAARHERLRDALFAAGAAGPPDRFVGPLADRDAAARYWAACGAGSSGVAGDAAARSRAIALLEPVRGDGDEIVAAAAGRWLAAVRQAAAADPTGPAATPAPGRESRGSAGR